MICLSSLDDLFLQDDRNFALAIGNFDGVHIGHRKLLTTLVSIASRKKLASVVITFSPHPSLYFKPEKKDFILTERATKFKLLKEMGINYVIVIEFVHDVQKLSAREFMENFRFSSSRIKHIHLGHDFQLGAGKEEARDILLEVKADDCEITSEKSLMVGNEKVSSTKIRELLKSAELFEGVSSFMGREYSLMGTTISGRGIGKSKLVATLNIKASSQLIKPLEGVYISKIKIDGQIYDSITNIGNNPTVTQDKELNIETHIFFFEENVKKGTEVEVFFHRYLRGEKKFGTIQELKNQIENDIIVAKKYHRENSSVKLALLGKNISHSKSQLMYEKIFKRFIDYKLLDCENEKNIPSLDIIFETYQGLSITSPYKKYFLPYTKSSSDFEAINCIKKQSKYFESTNTDFLAVSELVVKYEIKKHDTVILLGSGSMANMMTGILNKNNIDFISLSRKSRNIQNIDNFVAKDSDTCIINCCSRDYRFKSLKLDSITTFWDFNYDFYPHEEYFSKSNVNYIDGFEMLMLQAKYAVSFWNFESF